MGLCTATRSYAYGLFVTDYFTRTPRKLSPFRSFASIELFHFHIPEDTVIAVWNLITFKEQGGTFGDQCPDRSITVYFRSGAPSVINPLHTHFPRDTAVPGSFALTLTWTLPNRTTGVFNVTSPLPGDWFLAAHLPKDEGKISVKGLYEECQYLFQPQLIVQRLVNIAVLYPGYVTEQSMGPHNRSCLYKVFVPSYTSRVLVEVLRCHGAEGCPLWLRVRAKAPPLHNSTALDCREHAPCQLALDLPFWQHWYYVLVEKHPGVPGTVSFQVTVELTDCSRPSLARPPFLPSSASMNMPHSFGSAGGLALGDSPPPASPNGTKHPVPVPTASPAGERCWPVRPTLRNELDTFSVHFYIFFGPNVSVPPDRPAVFVINLLPVLDSGGVLNLELRLNVSSLCGENVTVFGCLNHEVPLTSGDNASVTCETESLAGFLLSVNATASLSRLRIPYPQTGSWYLSLRSLCATEHGFEPCTNVTAEVYLRAYLSPCINDCGIYGQCKLLRTNNYLYAACECKAEWNRWGCPDNAEACSYGFQLLSTLLLCLSNVMFVPPVAIAVRSHYLLEAAFYIFTMFFSTLCGGLCVCRQDPSSLLLSLPMHTQAGSSDWGLERGPSLWGLSGCRRVPCPVLAPGVLGHTWGAPGGWCVLLILVTSVMGHVKAQLVIWRTWGALASPWQMVLLVRQASEAVVGQGVQREGQEFKDNLLGSFRDMSCNLTLKVMHGISAAPALLHPRDG
nr:PREDICTED: transmembrane protein 8A-like [Opisthocomus hoazin]